MEVPRHWRMKKQRYAMVGETCPNCKSQVFPPRAVCPYCQDMKQESAAYPQNTPVLAFSERAQVVER
jgi:uncharacterized protein